MSMRKLVKGDEDALERFLCGHAETSMFLRSNLRKAGLDYRDEEYHGEYFGAFDEAGNVTGVLAHYWNGNIMMQAEDQAVLAALTAIFRHVVTRPVAGILGPDDQARTVIDELSLSAGPYAANRAEGLYALNLDDLVLPVNFDFAKARTVDAAQIDRAVLTRWIKAYDIEALGSEDDEMLARRVANRVNHIINGTDCWALLIDGEPFSLSGFNARLPDIVQIGPVWTPPEYRSRGYARALVALTLQKAQEQGAEKGILFTDNPAAVKAYESIGFEESGSYRLALLKKPVNLQERVQP